MEQIIIGIRADGNAQIGMGHLMRCLSVATALKAENVNVIFITSNEQSKDFIIEKGFFCEQLLGAYVSMEAETEELLHIIAKQDICMLLVDSYQATEAYLAQINKTIPVVYMDDLGRMGLPVSGLINYNIYGQDMGYKEHYLEHTKLWLGSKYAPVKPEFLQTPYEVKRQVQNVLVTMGGSDVFNIAGKLGEQLLEVLPEHVEITLICGRFSPHLQKVQALAAKNARVHVLTDVSDMWNVMAVCDIAITAAGSTMYELCTMGVPTICCFYVENQRRIAEGFGKQTDMLNAGDFSQNPDRVLTDILEKTLELIEDFEGRKRLSEQMKTVSDGKGAYRIAESLCNYVHNFN